MVDIDLGGRRYEHADMVRRNDRSLVVLSRS